MGEKANIFLRDVIGGDMTELGKNAGVVEVNADLAGT